MRCLHGRICILRQLLGASLARILTSRFTPTLETSPSEDGPLGAAAPSGFAASLSFVINQRCSNNNHRVLSCASLADRLFPFRGVKNRDVFLAGSREGFTPSRKGNNDPPLHGDPENKHDPPLRGVSLPLGIRLWHYSAAPTWCKRSGADLKNTPAVSARLLTGH